MIQIFRYGMVGIISNSVAYLIYIVLTYMGLTPVIAMTLLYISGAAIGFVGNRRWTFSHYGSAYKAMIRYGVAHAIGYLVNFGMLSFFVGVKGFPHWAVQAVSIVLVAVLLFALFRCFVFPESQSRYECGK